VALERVAVVGAGLAGLSAALRLQEAGIGVDLFERSRLLGGRATSFEIDGTEVDNGQHVFLACCTEFIDFAQAVGMGELLYLQERFDAAILSRDGRMGRLRASALPAPFHLTPSFATFSHLRLSEKLRVARALLSAMTSRPSPDESFETWLARNGQRGGERRAFWDPFFVPAINAPFDRVAAADAMFVLKTAFLGDAGAARFGFAQVPLAHLAAAAAKKLQTTHTATAVLSVTPNGTGVTIDLPNESAEYDAVVIATPPRQTEKILGEPTRYGVQNLDAYEPYPIIDVHLWHDGGSIGLDFAAALESPLQWIFEKTPGYLCCSISAADEYLRRPTQELETMAWREAQAFLPALRDAKLIRSAVTRNPEATWLPRIGKKRTQQRTTHPAIAIAGGWTETGWPDTMESAIRSGTIAADCLLASSAAQNNKPPTSGFSEPRSDRAPSEMNSGDLRARTV
jgi:squalene-associated FAD-dependent desaturase